MLKRNLQILAKHGTVTPTSRKQQGFTLIEVLIALVILAIGLPGLIYAIGTQVNQLSYLEEKMFSQWVASNQIAKIQIANRQLGTLSQGKASGVEILANRKWEWTSESKEFTSLQWRGIFIVETKVYLEENIDKDADPLVTDYAYIFNKNAKIPNLAALKSSSTALNNVNTGAGGVANGN